MEYKITFKRTHYVLASAEIYNTSNNTKKPFDALADECRNVHAYIQEETCSWRGEM